jgi:hypothetical protein
MIAATSSATVTAAITYIRRTHSAHIGACYEPAFVITHTAALTLYYHNHCTTASYLRYVLTEEQASEIACSLAMKADATATQAYLATTFTPAPAVDGVRDGELPLPKMPPHGPLHEALRPVVKHMNVQWTSTCGMAFFVMLCSRCVLQ